MIDVMSMGRSLEQRYRRGKFGSSFSKPCVDKKTVIKASAFTAGVFPLWEILDLFALNRGLDGVHAAGGGRRPVEDTLSLGPGSQAARPFGPSRLPVGAGFRTAPRASC